MKTCIAFGLLVLIGLSDIACGEKKPAQTRPPSPPPVAAPAPPFVPAPAPAAVEPKKNPPQSAVGDRVLQVVAKEGTHLREKVQEAASLIRSFDPPEGSAPQPPRAAIIVPRRSEAGETGLVFTPGPAKTLAEVIAACGRPTRKEPCDEADKAKGTVATHWWAEDVGVAVDKRGVIRQLRFFDKSEETE